MAFAVPCAPGAGLNESVPEASTLGTRREEGGVVGSDGEGETLAGLVRPGRR